jgi:L-ascorbate metabolism protein UlaG (beta-lactamase superfamily)
MSQSEMTDLLRMLKTRVIIPMHYFGPTTLNRFISTLDPSFKVRYSTSPEFIASMKTLPQDPTVVVLPGF